MILRQLHRLKCWLSDHNRKKCGCHPMNHREAGFWRSIEGWMGTEEGRFHEHLQQEQPTLCHKLKCLFLHLPWSPTSIWWTRHVPLYDLTWKPLFALKQKRMKSRIPKSINIYCQTPVDKQKKTKKKKKKSREFSKHLKSFPLYVILHNLVPL